MGFLFLVPGCSHLSCGYDNMAWMGDEKGRGGEVDSAPGVVGLRPELGTELVADGTEGVPSAVHDVPGGFGGGGKRRWLWVGLGVVLVFLLVFAGVLLRDVLKKRSEEKKVVTLNYWGFDDEDVIGGLVDEYRTKTGVIVNYTKQDKQDWRERLVSSLAKEGAPDVFVFHNTWVPALSPHLSSVPSDVLDLGQYKSSFYPVVAKDLSSGGSFVGIPLALDGLGLYINQDIFSSEGKAPPRTWNDLEKLAVELVRRDASGKRVERAGVALGSSRNVDHWQDILALMLVQGGVDLSNPDQKILGILSYFGKFTGQYRVWDETLPPSTQAFAVGKVAMYFAPSWRADEIRRLNPNLSFRVVPVPQLPKSFDNQPDVAWASYWVDGVWSKSKYQKEAWQFLSFLSSPNSLRKLQESVRSTGSVGFPYSRSDMRDLLLQDQYLGAYVNEFPVAVSGYLTSDTFDGVFGINTKMSAIWVGAIDGVVGGGFGLDDLPAFSADIQKMLTEFRTPRKLN